MTDSELVKTILTYVNTAEMFRLPGEHWRIAREAAERIQTLNAERQKFLQEISKSHEVINSLLPKVQEWVSADEKPEKYKPVFLWVKINGGAIAGRVEGMYLGAGKWCSLGMEWYDSMKVTHWMEFPADPEEGRT